MTKKTRVKVLDDLRQSLADAAAYERGERVNLRTQEIPPPPKPLKPAEIRRIRRGFNASQARDRLGIAAGAGSSLAAPVASREESNPGDARWRRSGRTRRSSGQIIR